MNFIYNTKRQWRVVLTVRVLVLVLVLCCSSSCSDVGLRVTGQIVTTRLFLCKRNLSWIISAALLVFTLKLKNMNKERGTRWAEGGAPNASDLKENWNKSTFQGLMSDIFTASHTIRSLLINKILTDQSKYSHCLSADQSEWCSADQSKCIFSAGLEAGLKFTQVFVVVLSNEDRCHVSATDQSQDVTSQDVTSPLI